MPIKSLRRDTSRVLPDKVKQTAKKVKNHSDKVATTMEHEAINKRMRLAAARALAKDARAKNRTAKPTSKPPKKASRLAAPSLLAADNCASSGPSTGRTLASLATSRPKRSSLRAVNYQEDLIALGR